MNKPPSSGRRLNTLGASGAVVLLSFAVAAVAVPAFVTSASAAECPPMKKELYEVVTQAKTLLQQNKAAEVLAKLKEADDMHPSACEAGVIDQFRLGAAVHAGNTALSAKTFQAISSSLPPAQAQQYTLAIAGLYLTDKNYPEAINWANRYTTSGGPNGAMAKQILLAAYQGSGDYTNLQKATLDQIAEREKAGAAPAEADLNLVVFTSDKLKDTARHGAMLEKLVTYYPTPDHWNAVILDVSKRPTFAHTRLLLDLMRLEFATGTLNKPDVLFEYAELAVQANALAEAKTAVDKGFEQKILGQGNDATRHGRLRDLIARKIEEEQKTNYYLNELDAKRAKTGDLAVDVGMYYYGLAKNDQAITWVNDGIAKGGLKNPDDAKLHLALVYMAAGQKPKAIEVLKTIKEPDGTADIAHLWIVKLGART